MWVYFIAFSKENRLNKSDTIMTPEENKPDDYLTIDQPPVSDICVTPR